MEMAHIWEYIHALVLGWYIKILILMVQILLESDKEHGNIMLLLGMDQLQN